MKTLLKLTVTSVLFSLITTPLLAQIVAQPKQAGTQKTQNKKKPRPPFKWVNPIPKGKFPGVKHDTFLSPSMKLDVGYCIFLPPGYHNRKNVDRKYPVVYYLHGGRPGGESKSVSISTDIHDAMKSGKVSPAIYVFVNGGPVSHYNMPDRKNAMGEDVFIKELIPHIDTTYRTIADRSGRGIEGFSQGRRGTARIMFKHPDLFCSAAPGGGGHATEKRISEENGRESDVLRFIPGYNTYDLARKYAAHPKPPFKILIYVGTKGFNYQNNLEYMTFLKSLHIPFEKLIIPDAPHSGRFIYSKQAVTIMNFHARNFKEATERK
jgi:hypothetical protein